MAVGASLSKTGKLPSLSPLGSSSSTTVSEVKRKHDLAQSKAVSEAQNLLALKLDMLLGMSFLLTVIHHLQARQIWLPTAKFDSAHLYWNSFILPSHDRLFRLMAVFLGVTRNECFWRILQSVTIVIVLYLYLASFFPFHLYLIYICIFSLYKRDHWTMGWDFQTCTIKLL